MSKATFRVELLDAADDRTMFDCGSPALNAYFERQATQDIRRRVAACFMAKSNDQRIAGFYTLASSSVLLSGLPPASAKKLPRCPSVPCVRMGRLAVDLAFKGKGLGGALLADALARAVRAEIAAFAMLVDAKDGEAADFYRHYGFIALEDAPLTLSLPLATVRPLAD